MRNKIITSYHSCQKTTNIIQEGPLDTLEKQSRPLLFKKERRSEEKKGDKKKVNAILSWVLTFF